MAQDIFANKNSHSLFVCVCVCVCLCVFWPPSRTDQPTKTSARQNFLGTHVACSYCHFSKIPPTWRPPACLPPKLLETSNSNTSSTSSFPETYHPSRATAPSSSLPPRICVSTFRSLADPPISAWLLQQPRTSYP